MSDMNLMMRIGAVLSSSFSTAFASANRSMRQLDNQTAQLTARQERIGAVMARSIARPHASLSRLHQQYERIGQAIERNRHAQERLNASMERSERISSMRSTAGGNLASSAAQLTAFALPVVGAMKQASNFQDQIIDLAITGEWTARQQASVGAVVRQSALEFNQTTVDINQGLGTLVAGGIQSTKELEIFAPKMSRIATAWRTSFEDIGKTAVALSDNLGIRAKGFDRAMNMLGYAGKAGQFEADDMAKWLPSLTPFYKAMGVQGEQAVAEIGAALQIARKGAGSSDEAANNMRNFMAKLTAPDTLRDFDKAHINLEANMKSMVSKGMTPMQAMMKNITDYIGTKSPEAVGEFNKAMGIKDAKERQMAVDRLNETYKLGALFQDQQALSFIRPMLGNQNEFERIKAGSVASANKDVIDGDFAKRMQSPTEQFKKFKIGITDLAITIGNALLPAVNQTITAVTPMVKRFASWAQKNPGLVKNIILLVGGLLLAKTAFWAVSFAVLSVVSPIMSAVTLFHRLRAGVAMLRGMSVLGRLAPMARRFGGAIALVQRAFMALRVVMMANPLGLAVGLLITAVVLIYRKWSGIKAFFVNLWSSLKIFANSGVTNIMTTIASFSPLGLFVRAFSAVFGYFGGLSGRFRTYGANIIQGLINGITAKIGAVKAKIFELGSMVSGAFRSTLGIRSPSRVFMGFGRNIADGVAIGINKQAPSAIKASDAMAKRLAQTQYSTAVLAKASVAGGNVSGGGGGSQQFYFNPTINLTAGNADEINQAMQISFEQFKAMMRRYDADKARSAWA